MFGSTEGPVYAGFWPRCAASLLDALFVSPLAVLQVWVVSRPGPYAAIAILPFTLVAVLYSVGLVYWFGGTPGKLIMRLCITDVDGAAVTLRQAALRSLPDLALGTLLSIGGIVTLHRLGYEEFVALSPIAQRSAFNAAAPAWRTPVQVAQSLWYWGELVALLTNDKRRALHDYLAGTVVIVRPRTAAGHDASAVEAT